MTDLDPCPFCECNIFRLNSAETGLSKEAYWEFWTLDWVCCTFCFAEGPAKKTTKEAIEAWNRRAG